MPHVLHELAEELPEHNVADEHHEELKLQAPAAQG